MLGLISSTMVMPKKWGITSIAKEKRATQDPTSANALA